MLQTAINGEIFKNLGMNGLQVFTGVCNKAMSKKKSLKAVKWALYYPYLKERVKHNVLITEVSHCLTKTEKSMSESSSKD